MNRRPRSAAGFTLIEMLVVMAITVVLLGLIFGPIISSFNFVSRARQTAEGQQEARRIMEQVTREAKDAIEVAVAAGDVLKLPQSGDPKIRSQGVRYGGYINAYDECGSPDRSGADPCADSRGNRTDPYPLYGALLDFVPADDTLGLHGGHLASPPVPQVTDDPHTHDLPGRRTAQATGKHNIIVRYFVGLRDPGYPHGNPSDPTSLRANGALPRWANLHVQNSVLGGPDVDNPYVLYRIEFDPDDPAYANWQMPDPNFRGRAANAPLVVNPDFFYDNRVSANGAPYWRNWRENAVAQTQLENIDLVRFFRAGPNNTGAVTQAQSTVTFTPLVVQNDAAVPAPGQVGSPLTYIATHGNWAGVQNDGTLTTSDFQPPALGVYPHIMVYQPARGNVGSDRLIPVYDNWATNANDPARPGASRLLTWDSRSGSIRFLGGGTQYRGGNATGGGDEIDVLTPLGPSDNGWQFDPLKLAVQQGKLTLPASLRPFVQLVPGSEVVTVKYKYRANPSDPNSALVVRTDVYRRSTSNRMMDTPPQPASWTALDGPYPATLPEPGTYVFDNESGTIVLGFPWPGPNNPLRPQPIPKLINGEPPVVTIHFAYQTNRPNDLVRVDYATRSLINVSMGIRMFDPSTSRPILAQLSDRAAMRNLGR